MTSACEMVIFDRGFRSLSTKRGQQRDIDRAKALSTEYKARKKALTRKAGGGKGKR